MSQSKRTVDKLVMGKHKGIKRKQSKGEPENTKQKTPSKSPDHKKLKSKAGSSESKKGKDRYKGCTSESDSERDDSDDDTSSNSESEDEKSVTLGDILRNQKQTFKDLSGMMNKFGKRQEEMTRNVHKIESQIHDLTITIADQGESLQYVHNEVGDMKAQQQALGKDLTSFQEQLQMNMSETTVLKQELNKMERKSRENNIRIIGVKEDQGEDCTHIVDNILSEKFDMHKTEIEAAHRTGAIKTVRGQTKPRHIIVKLLRRQDKYKVMREKADSLAVSNFFIANDLTAADMDRKRAFQPLIDRAR